MVKTLQGEESRRWNSEPLEAGSDDEQDEIDDLDVEVDFLFDEG